MNNQVMLIGYVGCKPKAIQFSDTGNKVVKFSLAVKEFHAEDATLWIDVDAWNGLGDRVLMLISKGREVVLFGRLGLTVYKKEREGRTIEVHKPVVKLSSFHLCGHRDLNNNSE